MMRTEGLQYIRILLAVVLLAGFLRGFILEALHVPTRSMESSILPGDFLIVSRVAVSLRLLRSIIDPGSSFIAGDVPGDLPPRGGVVMFRLPWDVETSGTPEASSPKILKRCVAVAGDTVSLRGGVLFVNGKRRAGPPVEPGDFLGEGVTLTVPRRGDILRLDSASAHRWIPLIRREAHIVSLSAAGIVFIDGRPDDKYIVENDHIFMLGDNSPRSLDSRHWGFLRADWVSGEPLMVYWSVEPGGGIRWDRIGTMVR